MMVKIKYIGGNRREISEESFSQVGVVNEAISLLDGQSTDVTEEAADWLLKNEPYSWSIDRKNRSAEPGTQANKRK
jgi:hypothetical protein